MMAKLQSRELQPATSAPAGEPLLRISTQRTGNAILRFVDAWSAAARLLERFLRRDRRDSGQGTITFHPHSVHFDRRPVRALGERDRQRQDLAYADITRLEFVPPETITLGYGIVTPELNQQAALDMQSLAVQDAFDSIVELMEQRADHTYSILDGDNLTHSKPWTWSDRFPDLGMTNALTIQLIETHPVQWRISTPAGTKFRVTAPHGLILTTEESPEHAILQVLGSQVIDGTGFALSQVDANGRNRGFYTSRDERLWIDPDGDLWLDEEMVGSMPGALGFPKHVAPDTMPILLGAKPEVAQPRPLDRMHLRTRRALPMPWLLTLALLALSSPH